MSENYSDLLAASSAGFTLVFYLFYIAWYALIVVAMWKMFEKAGKPGWTSLIPFYNFYWMFEISWGKGWLVLVYLFVPCANIVVYILMSIKLAKAYGQSTAFGVGLILLQPIFLMILGFGDAQYIGSQE